MLRLHDSALGRTVRLEPRAPGEFSMYVCGPTVYDYPHIGHGRAMLTWDVLRRWVTYRGLAVTHVANVTDVDDHIIERAAEEQRSEAEVAATYEAEWWGAADRLGALRPHHIPHATEFIPGMIEVIEELLALGRAYTTSDGVYFDTTSVPDYGLLALQPLSSLREGARIEANPEKRSPLDFVLWKGAKPGEPTWAAPFGAGRPGWHTECVAMSLQLLGEGFDLHGGGMDLRFPHHENERAQAVALGKSFARHWIHHGWVEVLGEKMSKSLGNFTTLPELLAVTDSRAYRLLVVRAHYRSPIEVTADTLEDATNALGRLDALARRFDLEPVDTSRAVPRSDALDEDWEPVARFLSAMDDDLDVPTAIAALFELVTMAHAAEDRGEHWRAHKAAAQVAELAAAVGLAIGDRSSAVGDDALALAAARDRARARGEYAEADRLRGELVAQGYVVEDTPRGTVLRRGSGS